jgi:protein TonB
MQQMTIDLPTRPVLTMSGSTIIAGIVTFSLFVLMARLIENNEIPEAVKEAPVLISPIFEQPKENTIQKPKPLPPPEIKARPEPTKITQEVDPSLDLVGFNPNPVDIEPINIDSGLGKLNQNGEVRPVIRVPPKYPVDAARDGLEGWVELSFSVTESGGVDNIEVIDSKPRRTFDQAARRALAKWKYRPKIVDGKALVQHGLTVKLLFNLDSE